MYPGEVAEGGKAKGKLRLMYELAPLSMIAEQAGGRGTTGKRADSRYRSERDSRAASDLHRQRGGSGAGRIVQRRRLKRSRFRWSDKSWPAMSVEPKPISGSSSIRQARSNSCASIATRPRSSRASRRCARNFSAPAATVNAACLGVPGPIIDGRAHATNVPWELSSTALSRVLKGVPVRLLNDLAAIAYGMVNLKPAEFVVLHRAENPPAHGNIAVIAAGTGLGESSLVWEGRQILRGRVRRRPQRFRAA